VHFLAGAEDRLRRCERQQPRRDADRRSGSGIASAQRRQPDRLPSPGAAPPREQKQRERGERGEADQRADRREEVEPAQ